MRILLSAALFKIHFLSSNKVYEVRYLFLFGMPDWFS